MSEMLEVKAPQTIERGSIAFLSRPRIEEPHTDDHSDVQRLLILLNPGDSPFTRLIAIGRKRLHRSAHRDRFWGFVDLVLTAEDMAAALGAQTFGMPKPESWMPGLRHLPAARTFAEGTYDISSHGDHTHLRWHVEHVARDPIAFEVQIEKDADYILTVANPDPTVWGMSATPDLQRQLFDDLELHVLLPALFPPALQQRLGNRRFAPIDSTQWLDHPGAELVFIGGHEVAEAQTLSAQRLPATGK